MSSRKSKYLVVVPQGLEWCTINLISSKNNENNAISNNIDIKNIKIIPPHLSQDELKSLLEEKEHGVIKYSSPEKIKRKRQLDDVNDINLNNHEGENKKESFIDDGRKVKNKNNEIFIGYYYENGKKYYVSIKAGLTEGISLVQFDIIKNNDEAVKNICRLRGMGPLLAHIQSCNIGQSLFSSSLTLDEAESCLLTWINTKEYYSSFQNAFDLWLNHVLNVWIPTITESTQNNNTKSLSSYGIDPVYTKKFLESFQEKRGGNIPFTYRVSCVRSYSNAYSYKREELLSRIAGVLIPFSASAGATTSDSSNPVFFNNYPMPTVNLTNYDFEIVLFILNTKHPVIGITLSPYRFYKCKDFSNGKVPADITPPYITGKTGHDARDLVTLRPSTARLLLQCVRPKIGDIILDPCAGIGTLPVEAGMLGYTIGLGGDISTQFQESVVVPYMNQVRQSSVCTMINWDAALLPICDSSIDVVISDLPFGVRCLSANRIEAFLPLLMAEVIRILRVGGKILFLCTNASRIIKCVQGTKQVIHYKAIFPVNIGGIVAWVVMMERGQPLSDEGIYKVKNHRERVKKLVHIRNKHKKI